MVEGMPASIADGAPGEWPALAAWPSFPAAYERALVVLAMNQECWIEDRDGQFALHADPQQEPAIRRELALYEAEESQRRERVEPPVFPAGFDLAGLWVVTLVAVFVQQARWPEITDRFSNSSLSLVRDGEWWRPFTSLFLHADTGHLLGNVFIGGIFCLMVAQSVGAFRGWLLILAGGTLGNALNAWLHFPAAFSSIGASTATFAAVGLLVAGGCVNAWKAGSPREFRPLLLPLFVGTVLLGMFGAGGGNTDVSGHVLGTGAGFLLGFVTMAFPKKKAAPGEGGGLRNPV
jgi:rhomboid protease GluP